jgi:hypothetical protein
MHSLTCGNFLRVEVIVEFVDPKVPKVTKSIPLATGLRIHVIEIIKDARTQGMRTDLVFEGVSMKGWMLRVQKRPTECC